jgi:hypothetical protein
LTTSWSETASDIITDAYLHLGVLGVGEAADADQVIQGLRALDGVLKELPLFGYQWPKLSINTTSVTWTSGQTVTLPTDYFNYAVINSAVSGKPVLLSQIPTAIWNGMPDRSTASGNPTHFYIDPAGTVFLYPTPTVNPVLTIQYQKIINDSSQAVVPDMLQFWIKPLGYGVAFELALKHGKVGTPKYAEIKERWFIGRKMAIENSQQYEPIDVEVRDAGSNYYNLGRAWY